MVDLVEDKKKAIAFALVEDTYEPIGLWIMRGVCRFLTDPSNHEAKMLRQNFIFKLIPRLNNNVKFDFMQ